MSHTKTLRHSFLPELGLPRQGKVREIYEIDDTLALISSDRISVFDRILPHPIQDKGRVLTKLSHFWFEKTKDLVANHLISHPDPNVLIVKKCQPIMIEVIVRGYLAGSLARDYQAGKRKKCGITLPEGLKLNDPLPNLIVTPTTKNHHGHDEDITKEELISKGVVTPELWNKIEKAALKLYTRGQEIVGSKGLILVDTKYEFGLDKEGHLTLIDEIHTPDSSRFWFKNDYANKQVRYPDKEFIREWMRGQGFIGEGSIPELPQEVREKASHSYREIYEIITGDKLQEEHEPVAKRLLNHLKRASLIKGMHALIISGSEKDQAHVDKITAGLTDEGIPFHQYVSSAHKHPARVSDLIEQYNESLEPLVCISVAGRSNALSGVIAARLKWPVIACPPFKDYGDYLANIHSSLQMPSQVPSMTVIDPLNAALAAAKILRTMEISS